MDTDMSKWTYHWYDGKRQAHFSHDFITGKWARNGITEPVCTFRGYYEQRIQDPDFVQMQIDYFNLVTKPRIQKLRDSKSSQSKTKSAPKATSKIKSFVKRKK